MPARPNGAGKSTLLRVLTGLLPVHDGFVRLAGRVLDDPGLPPSRTAVLVPPEQRRIGVVFQDLRLFPHLDVLDNLAYPARAGGSSRAAARAGVRTILERLELTELATSLPRALSGGQAARVALGRALARSPELLLLDEPLAALDAGSRLTIRSRLRDYLAGSHLPGGVILVTHDPVDALVLADRIVVMEGGRIAQQGAPADIARHPRTAYVAGLLGLNLLPGTVAQLSGSTATVTLAGGGTLTGLIGGSDPGVIGPGELGSRQPGRGEPGVGDPGKWLAVGAPVLVVLRPSAIAVHSNEPGSGSPRSTWQARVSGLDMLTDRVRVTTLGPPDLLIDLTPQAVIELALAPGEPVWLSVKATEVSVFAG